MATNRSRFEQLLDEYEPRLAAAFRAAIDQIKSAVTIKVLVERLERGDVAGAIEALRIEPEVFGQLEMEIAQAYFAGGNDMASSLKLRGPDGQRLPVFFGVRNLPAENWLASHSAELVTRATDDMKDSIREVLTEGLVRGDNPTRTALNIVGRKSRVTGRREGGIIGLSGPHARAVAKARSALISGDPSAMREVLGLTKLEKRFHSVIQRAIRDGKPLPLDQVDRITGRLADAYLKLRGDAIGLNETFNALSKARDDAMRQAIVSGKVDARFVKKVWRHSGKEHARVQHRRMSGTEVGYFDDFVMPDGTRIPYPHAPGIPASHSVFCGCFHEYRVDYTAQLIERRRAA